MPLTGAAELQAVQGILSSLDWASIIVGVLTLVGTGLTARFTILAQRAENDRTRQAEAAKEHRDGEREDLRLLIGEMRTELVRVRDRLEEAEDELERERAARQADREVFDRRLHEVREAAEREVRGVRADNDLLRREVANLRARLDT